MATKAVRIPGPDHPISIEPQQSRVRVLLGDLVIAETHNALTLREARYPAIYYIPREDADMTLLTRSEHTTYCPFKGDCNYFNLPSDSDSAANAVWAYEKPFEAVAAIEGYLAFYPDRVTIEDAAMA